jgi:phosphoglycerate kinase
MPLIKKFAKSADHFFIGGALLNDLLLAKGYEIGKSVYEAGYDVSAVLKNKKLLLPIDLVVMHAKKVRICAPYEVKKNEEIVDVGPETIKYIISVAGVSKFVLWNGPVGYYDFSYTPGTKNLVKGLSKIKGDVLIGGGDTVAVVSQLKLEKKFTFVSTGGGATLDFLVEGTLAGIEALK